MEVNLFEKTELWITDIILNNVDLNIFASVVAEILGLQSEKVLVVDVRESHVTLDILEKVINAEKFFGKKATLLEALSQIAGVTVTKKTEIHSDGILGAIVMDDWRAEQIFTKTKAISAEIAERIKNKAIVFPTGFEVKDGMIKDTNTPYIAEQLQNAGYRVSEGEILDDDSDLIAGSINRSIDEGFGLIITSGGIGAEEKDKTIEGVLKVDPQAATPYLAKFQKGEGRHIKDGVRIGVGQVENSFIIALPGPNDEVRIAMKTVICELKKGTDKEKLSNHIANALRQKYHHGYIHLNNI